MNRKHKFLGVYNQLWVILLWFTRSILSLWQRLLWFPDTEESSVSLSECKCYTSWYCLLFYQLIRADGKERSLLMFRASLGCNNTNLTNSQALRRKIWTFINFQRRGNNCSDLANSDSESVVKEITSISTRFLLPDYLFWSIIILRI